MCIRDRLEGRGGRRRVYRSRAAPVGRREQRQPRIEVERGQRAGEHQAVALGQADRLVEAHPGALQLRLLETVVPVASEKNSTLLLPFPVELLRFLENHTEREAETERESNTDRASVP